MHRDQSYSRLVARGCLCGTDRPAECRLHPAGDNRGIAAWFKAGMPSGFPMVATCAICGASGLLYPDIDLDDPNDAERFGYVLNDRRVFALDAAELAKEFGRHAHLGPGANDSDAIEPTA